jgi:tetratricopeptide (TPR) repeat protein
MERRTIRVYRKCILCLVLSIVSFSQPARSQGTAQGNDFLPPPRPNLLPLRWPDLTALEPEVREQLTKLQAALVATAKNQQAPAATLSEAFGVMGENYQSYSLNVAARVCYLNANNLTPQDFRWIYLLGKLDQQEDRIDDAVRRYRLARTLRPEYLAVPVNLGNIYLQLNRLDEAKENFKSALAIDQSCAAALYGLGQVALSQRNYGEAIANLEAALQLAPGANRIHYALAMAYRNLGDLKKATAHLAQQGTAGVRVNDPLFDGLQELITGERIHLVRGKLALDARSYKEAIDEFRLVIAANPNSLPARINLGAALVQTGDTKAAAANFDEALRIDPRNTNAHYNLAALLANENQHEAAIRHLREILNTEPNDAGARSLLATELRKTGKLDEALLESTRVAEADPDNEEAVLSLIRLLQQKREYKQALDLLKKAHEQYPEKGQTALMLAVLLATSPQYDLRDGATALQLARMIFDATSSPEHGALVAMALAELGRCAEAADWQRRMIALAQQQQKTDIATRLNADLKLYERQPCRPPGQAGNEN